MVYPEVCLLFKNNAIYEHTLKLASEATVCWCPLILQSVTLANFISNVVYYCTLSVWLQRPKCQKTSRKYNQILKTTRNTPLHTSCSTLIKWWTYTWSTHPSFKVCINSLAFGNPVLIKTCSRGNRICISQRS